MKSLSNFMRFGIALVATAGISAGTAYAWREATRFPSDAKDEVVPIRRDKDAQQLLDWLSTRAMPRLDQATATQEIETAALNLSEPPLMHQLNLSSDACYPRWRPLLMGPVGREVTNLCPGLTLNPVIAVPAHARLKLELPTIGYFNKVLRGAKLDSSLSTLESDRADAEVLGTLQSRFTRAEVPLSRPLTFVNPLGWSATSNAQAIANTVEGGHG